MTKVLFCTGKKKRVKAVLDYFLSQDKENRLTVLSTKLQTKRVLFFNYDELRVLFQVNGGGGNDLAPMKLLQGVEYFTFKDQAQVLMDFESPLVNDEMLKVKVLTACHPFIARGVRCKVTLKKKKETEFRVFYHVVGQLHGPADGVLQCRDHLINDNLLDPEKTSFLF
ncbi:hypothetical protein [Acanthopleuribacter pedis]|uniref:Uncharacterized protein n=1 Tax=Acanthopleuribacter pedis TaxID=442870 RepID=A0A8J7QCD5_9BACT|nr:hypothetical protein [Acanthopleuribacter pedis]MBO1321169.1 hypothetical protein [Acanthopleuribacter pedis]